MSSRGGPAGDYGGWRRLGPRRGEVWWASMREPVGSVPGYRMPALVFSSHGFNRIRTVPVAAVTGTLRVSETPGNVPVGATDSGLPRDSVVNVS